MAGTVTSPGTAARSATSEAAPAPGMALVLRAEQYGSVWAAPLHQLVTPAAPSQDIDRCTWLRWQEVSSDSPALAGSMQLR